MAKIGPGLNSNSLRAWIEDADADDVAGQQVGSELDALERAVEGVRQRVRQRGLAHAGDVFDQQMAAREQRDQREVDDFVLAANDAGNGVLELGNLRVRGGDHGLQFVYASVR